ncbi:MAG: DUF72 domain-containing protein, partial [Actinobacteria bacterium]|nr:DUF72 domain-containing protein [Actinomycetota bacterium]
MTADAFVGISGWRYPRWRGDFYPRGLVQRRELEYVGERLRSVELNGSFYSLQRPSSYHRWRAEVPDGFVFAVKGSRYVTHMLRLVGVRTALANFYASGVLALGPTLGPFLWQLPERVEFDPDVLAAFLAELPRTTGDALALARQHDDRLDGRTWLEIEADVPLRHALEPRSPSFSNPLAADILRAHGVSLVFADTAGRWPVFDAVTADHVYVRLHGSQELYASGYGDDELDAWAARIRGWRSGDGSEDGMPRDVYVYFDNDARGR